MKDKEIDVSTFKARECGYISFDVGDDKAKDIMNAKNVRLVYDLPEPERIVTPNFIRDVCLKACSNENKEPWVRTILREIFGEINE